MAKGSKTKIVLTGGHAATTALATVEEIIRRKKDWQIYWIGSKAAVEGQVVTTLESEVFPKLGVAFHPIEAGRIQRQFTLWTIPALLKIPIGFVQAASLLFKIKPKAILSFGGSAAFPVVVCGWALGIPVIIHEQTAVAGRANRASSFFARKIALARETSRKYFPAAKSVITGNPILTQIAEISPKTSVSNPPVIFVTGGSRGSRIINESLAKILKNLLKDYYVIHQTGPLDFEKFVEVKKTLSVSLKKNYEVYSRVDPMQIDNIYRQADIVVARAGANTTSEVIAAKRPAILIPIPFSYLDEQTENALYAKEFGIAKIISQETLTPRVLLKAISEVLDNWGEMLERVRLKKSPDITASKKLTDLLERAVE